LNCSFTKHAALPLISFNIPRFYGISKFLHYYFLAKRFAGKKINPRELAVFPNWLGNTVREASPRRVDDEWLFLCGRCHPDAGASIQVFLLERLAYTIFSWD
jgi:hypothetical protein